MGVIQARTAPRVSQGCSISLFSPIKLGKMTVHLISIRKNGNLYNRKSHFLGEIDNFFYFVLVFFFLLACNVLFYTFLLQDDQCVVLNLSKNISSGRWC